MSKTSDTDAVIQPDVADVQIEDDAVIQPDVAVETHSEEDVEVEVEVEVKSSRDEMMDSIVARRSEILEDELEDEALETPETPETPETSETPETDQITVKIDGEELQVTPQQIAEYQKNRAADVRIDEASALQKANEERAAELDRREAELVERQESTPATPAVPDADISELSKQLTQAVFDEDHAAVADIMVQLRAPKTDVVRQDPVDVGAAVSQELFRREQKKAIGRFEEEYEVLAKDTALRSAVNERSKIEGQEDPDADVWTILDRSAKHVVNDLTQKFGGKTPANDMESRKQRKAAAGDAVKAKTSGKAPVRKPEAPKVSAFEQIKRGRGQG